MMSTKRLRLRTLLGILVVGGAMSACAATTPSQELMDARKAYNEVASSEANKLAPARVLTAKQALERAEAAHNEEPGSFEEKSLAYVAQREAQRAAAYADMASAQNDRERAEQDYRETQEYLRRKAEDRLSSARTELERVRGNLTDVRTELENQGSVLNDRTRELTEKERRLEERMRELEAERTARKKAEAAAAAAMASLEQIANVKEEARGTVITLSGAVLFKTGESDLLPIAERRLDAVAEALKDQEDGTTIVVEGHTDSRGSAQMNMELSRNRAESVRSYLVGKGVEPERIKAVGKGEAQPIATNDTPEGRANNRRVEIVLQKPENRSGS